MAFTEPATVRLQRLLPGPIEKVWSYITDSELRGKWLATGPMDLRVGGKVELVWRNDNLTDHREERPPGFGRGAPAGKPDHPSRSAPPSRFRLGWRQRGDVSTRAAAGRNPAHDHAQQAAEPQPMLGVSSGWHAHVDVLEARLRGEELPFFWRNFSVLKAEYDKRIPQ